MPEEGPKKEHREKRADERGRRKVEHFQTSTRGLRHVFKKHFPSQNGHVEALAYHLAQVEVQLPMTREAIRLARYPGAGNRNARRMALGLWENLSALEVHLRQATASLEKLAKGAPDEAAADEEE